MYWKIYLRANDASLSFCSASDIKTFHDRFHKYKGLAAVEKKI